MNKNFMAAIMPHPPIIIPAVGGDEIKKVEKTIAGMKKLSKNIVEFNPETIVIVTPHSYMESDKFNFYTNENLIGSFIHFGASEIQLHFENDIELLNKISEKSGDKFEQIPPGAGLDHGSLVPLYYLFEAGFRGKIVVFNYCALDIEDHIKYGILIREAIDECDKNIAFIASGDLSHRLIPSAPAGFNPQGEVFDEMIVDKIKKGDYQAIIDMKQSLRFDAGECAYNSLMTVFGVLNNHPVNNKIYSYEGPFGVGYLVAEL